VNQPNTKLARLSAAAAMNGTRGPSVPSSPPSAGPDEADAKAMPIRPKLAARFSGGVTSAI
jgi:hypothetical protein